MGRGRGFSGSHRFQWLVNQLWIDVWAVTVGVLVNSVLGAEIVPRVVRGLGYRLLGLRSKTFNIFPGLRVAGRLRNVSIGAGTFINRDCFIEAVGEVRIGEDCQFGPQVTILTSHHPIDSDGKASKMVEPRPVTVGRGAWIGARAVLVPGVTVGEDVVIGAGAVVSRDCREPGRYVGVPARRVEDREPDPLVRPEVVAR